MSNEFDGDFDRDFDGGGVNRAGVNRRTVLKGASAGAIMALLRSGDVAADSGAAGRTPGALNASTTRTFAANQTVTTLIPNRLYRIGCIVRAERLSWLPEDIDAFEPINGYVVLDDANCVFLDMASPIARPAVEYAVSSLVGKRKVWVSFTRNEADCIGNMGYVLGTCRNPTMLYGSAGGILEWINHPAVSQMEVQNFLGRIPMRSSRNGETTDIGSLTFDWMDAGLKQMLMTQWAFEKSTGCLFTSDSFGYSHAKTADSPAVVETAKGLPGVEAVAKEMVERCNWMRESTYPDVIERFESIFEKYDVQMLAPVHGCVIKGRDAVKAHVRRAAEALRYASKLPDTERKQYV